MINDNKKNYNAWDVNADFWDSRMGDDSNKFHREVVRPHTELLLDINENEYILDVACGNGNFSKRLAELGAKVVAFDYSQKMIENAKKRQEKYLNKINFYVCDATIYEQLTLLKKERLFDKAVANMAIMDIALINPLIKAVNELLNYNGIFVFSIQHPCFIKPKDIYMTSTKYAGEAIKGQPVLHNYYHRSLQEIFQCCFNNGFVIDGFFEETDDVTEIPAIVIIRLRKLLINKT